MMYFKCLRQIFRRGLIPAAILMLTVAATSCSNNDFEETPTPESGRIPDGNYIISFRITTPDGIGIHPDPDVLEDVADGDLIYGDDGEHAIGDEGNFAIFFRGAQKKVYAVQELKLDNYRLSQETEDNIEYYYSAQLKIASSADEVEQLEQDAANARLSCIVVLNAGGMSNDIKTQLIGMTPAQVREKLILKNRTNPGLIGFDGNRFTMSNTLYMNGEQEHFDVTIPKEAIYYDPDIPGQLVRIQVERLVAKFTFESSNTTDVDGYDNVYIPADEEILYCYGFDDDGDPLIKKKKYRVRFINWGVNAYEQESYLMKNIKTPAGSEYPNGWNDPGNYRTYWAEDVNYDKGNYAMQYRRAVDNKALPYYENLFEKSDNTLKNYSYNELKQGLESKIVYVPENTYATSKIEALDHFDNTRTDVLAGTHVIVCAELLTNINDDNKFEAIDVYRDVNGVFYDNPQDCFRAMMRSFNLALASHYQMQYHYYDWGDPLDGNANFNQDTLYTVLTQQLIEENRFRLYYKEKEDDTSEVLVPDMIKDKKHDDLFIPATVVHGDGRVIPWLDGMTIMNVKGEVINVYKHINEIEGVVNSDPSVQRDPNTLYVNDRKSLIYDWTGAIDHFKDGKMYYAAPAHIDDTTCGVVRNSWYRYKLSAINKIGTPVDNPDQPIVPEEVFTKDRVSLTVNIIDWHGFNTSSDNVFN